MTKFPAFCYVMKDFFFAEFGRLLLFLAVFSAGCSFLGLIFFLSQLVFPSLSLSDFSSFRSLSKSPSCLCRDFTEKARLFETPNLFIPSQTRYFCPGLPLCPFLFYRRPQGAGRLTPPNALRRSNSFCYASPISLNFLFTSSLRVSFLLLFLFFFSSA